MDSEHKQHDEAVDKILAALREAAPPEGMEARIAQRLANHAAVTPTSTRPWLAGSTFTGAWWRGAIVGAAAATLAICAVLLVQHRSRTTSAPTQTATGSAAARSFTAPPQATLTSQSRTVPCSHTTVFRVDTSLPAKQPEELRAQAGPESTAPSRPAPELPLTPQERSLARLAHTADPRELASLSPEIQSRLEAEHAAEFRKFFTPPPAPPVPERIPDVTPDTPLPSAPEPAPPVKE
jgi:hypothetical protein